jgi:hypothetical protein
VSGTFQRAGLPLLVALAVALAACSERDDDAQRVATSNDHSASADAAEARRLAAEIGRVSDDRGPKAQRDRLLAVLRRAQRAFRAGHGRTVCATMSSEPLETFGGSIARCAARAESLAAAVRTGRMPLPAPAVAWVRVYGDLGGITMVNPDGDRFRLPFVKRDGRWGAHYFFDARPEVFNVQLSR